MPLKICLILKKFRETLYALNLRVLDGKVFPKNIGIFFAAIIYTMFAAKNALASHRLRPDLVIFPLPPQIIQGLGQPSLKRTMLSQLRRESRKRFPFNVVSLMPSPSIRNTNVVDLIDESFVFNAIFRKTGKTGKIVVSEAPDDPTCQCELD